MRKNNHTNERWTFIDTIQGWFSQRSKFWALISLFTLMSLITLQIFFIFLAKINLHIRQEIDSLLIPLLVLFVFSIFWRGSVQTFLSFASVMSMYAGMSLVYIKAAGLQTLPPVVTNRLGYGKIAISSSTDSVASLYFLGGIIGLIICILISFKPSLFKAKGTQFKPSYPVWKSDDDPKSTFGFNAKRLSLFQVYLALLSGILLQGTSTL